MAKSQVLDTSIGGFDASSLPTARRGKRLDAGLVAFIDQVLTYPANRSEVVPDGYGYGSRADLAKAVATWRARLRREEWAGKVEVHYVPHGSKGEHAGIDLSAGLIYLTKI
jgi:hypothetical protein|tara:strand:- start:104 stop:436 length:333 start_codon:yes stop_codon:yes gene_type:complete